MASPFASLLTRSNSLDKLKTAVSNVGAKSFKDENIGYWNLTPDKLGNASAIIRFLPPPPPESVPFATFFRHAFQGPNGWYIELSRTSINENDPVSEFNSRLWATKDETLQNQVRKQSRKPTFVANIYVVQDKANPDNEGKVFLYRFGKKIFEKIKKALEPEFAEDVPFDPFHVLEGANFRLRQKKQAGFPNYDDSVFETPRPLLNGDEAALTAVFQNLKPIAEITAPDKFKTYEELKKRLDKIMGFDTSVYLTPSHAAVDTGMSVQSAVAENRAAAPVPTTRYVPTATIPNDDDDDTADRLSKFDDDND